MGRVLLLLPTSTYRTTAFLNAAARLNAAGALGVQIVVASEEPSTLASKNPEGLLTLNFADPESVANAAIEFASHYPIDAVIAVDEVTAVVAAHINHALGLDPNQIAGAEAARNKYMMREALRTAGLPVPRYLRFTLDDDPAELAGRVIYPCVVKPVFLSASRGVIRADNPAEFQSAVARIGEILKMPRVRKRGGSVARDLLAEEFIPGDEIALEGLLDPNELKVLAIFDKPDPLNGPFFEETIYVTPSRLPDSIQVQARQATLDAARAMGLIRGPLHAELRINEKGLWVIEVAARSIGGLCSRSLKFAGNLDLEEVLLMHALGMDVSQIEREASASGVMMIPVPRAGTLKAINGLERGRAVEFVEDIVITAHITQEVAPPPEGGSYLGFIFARADRPEEVEWALRQAHSKLDFEIEPLESRAKEQNW